MHVFSSAYNEYTVISKEYTGPLDFDITGVNCILLNPSRILAFGIKKVKIENLLKNSPRSWSKESRVGNTATNSTVIIRIQYTV